MRRRFDSTPPRPGDTVTTTAFGHASGHTSFERRAVSRLAVDLEATWRLLTDRRPPQLVFVTDLSARGARVVSWHSMPLVPGDRLELHCGREPFEVTVRRVLGHCEFGVEFTGLSAEQRMRLVRTIGNNRVAPSGWD